MNSSPSETLPLRDGLNALCLSASELRTLKNYQEKGFRIATLAEKVWHGLTATFALATFAFAFVAIKVSSPWIFPCLTISTVAFSVLLLAEVLSFSKPLLKGSLLSVYGMAKAICIDLVAKITCLILYPFRQTLFDPRMKQSEQETPILLVHGYLHNSSGWAYFRYRLNLMGYHNIFTVDLGNPFVSIESQAQVVNKKIEEIRRITKRDDVHLIGHSMGGVVSSYYATKLAKEVNVKSIITLGTPLYGTKLRFFGVGVKQLAYRSQFLKNLRQAMRSSGIPFYHIGSRCDLIVRPPSSTVIKKHKFTLFSDLGHCSYLFSDKVICHCLFFYLNKEDLPKIRFQ